MPRNQEGRLGQIEYEAWLRGQKKAQSEFSASLPDDGFEDAEIETNDVGKIRKMPAPKPIGGSSLDD